MKLETFFPSIKSPANQNLEDHKNVRHRKMNPYVLSDLISLVKRYDCFIWWTDLI